MCAVPDDFDTARRTDGLGRLYASWQKAARIADIFEGEGFIVNYIKQFSIILLFAFLGEILRAVIPLPVPASIYGILLLFLALERRWLAAGDIREAVGFLIQIMPILFVPPAVGIMQAWGVLKPDLGPYLLIVIASTVLVILVTGRFTQFILRAQMHRLRAKALHEKNAG